MSFNGKDVSHKGKILLDLQSLAAKCKRQQNRKIEK